MGSSALEWAGLAVWLGGASLEAVADRQLAAFRRDEAHRGAVIDVGVWRFSRHPNYFGQWLTWCGYALVGLAAPWGWVGLLSPALMLYLILFVTGIPPLSRSVCSPRAGMRTAATRAGQRVRAVAAALRLRWLRLATDLEVELRS